MQLNAQKQTLAALLGGLGYQLVIPPYQRPYAWGREQVDDLWDDLVSAVGQGHFMGSLVLNAEDEQKPQVIDGQQRLTTLLLLISLVRDRYLALGATAKAEPLYYLLFADPFASGDNRFRLRTGDANWPVFRDFVLRRHDDPEHKTWDQAKLEPRPVRARNEALFENARVLDDKLSGWLGGLDEAGTLDRLDKLKDTMIQRLEFVVVAVGSAPDAFLLFETLNDRGLQLSQGDLLKNHLLSRVALETGDSSNDEVEAAGDEWEGLLDDLGASVDVTKFLRHYLLGTYFPVKKEQVFDRFKAQVAASGSRQLLKQLREFGKLYGEFADPARVDSDSELQAQLHALNVLRAETCYPALLAARRFLARDDFIRFARLCEILTFRYSSVSGLNAGDLQAAYSRSAKLLLESQGGDLDAARAEIEQMLPGTEQFIAAFRHQRMGAQYLARYTLQRIERALNPGKEFKGNDAVHIEHVMPQTPNNEWKAGLGAELIDHPALVNRWGNLTLLHGPLNSGIGNSAFRDKQAAYEESEVSLTKDLCSYLRWGLDIIDERQQWMATIANSVWSVEGYAPPPPQPPVQMPLVLDTLSAEEQARLATYSDAGPPGVGELAGTIKEHRTLLATADARLAGSIGDALDNLLARWDLLGTEGQRLAAGAVAYFADVTDSINDLQVGGLDDDLRVVQAVCEALAFEELAPDA